MEHKIITFHSVNDSVRLPAISREWWQFWKKDKAVMVTNNGNHPLRVFGAGQQEEIPSGQTRTFKY